MKLPILNNAKYLLIFVVGGILSACSGGPAPGEWEESECSDPLLSFADPRAERASAMLRETLSEDRGSGLAAAVMIDGKLVWSDAAGTAGGGKSLTTKGRLRLGSVSKPFTAAIVAALVEQGLIDIDQPIQTYVPSFPQKSEAITIRHLLTHTSGIRHYDFGNFSESNNQEHFDSAADSLFLFVDDELIAPPGEGFHYSSFGYNLIGAAIEKVTGQSYRDALQTYVSDPLNLRVTTIDDASTLTQCRPRFTTNIFGWLPITTFDRDHSEAYASAGVLSAPQELVELAHQFFNGDFIETDTRQTFLAPGTLNNGEKIDWAHGWDIMRDETGEIEWYGHGGATNGAHASIRYYPKTQTVIAGISTYNYWLTDSRPAMFMFWEEGLKDIFN